MMGDKREADEPIEDLPTDIDPLHDATTAIIGK
jgi:hypothetical protein